MDFLQLIMHKMYLFKDKEYNACLTLICLIFKFFRIVQTLSINNCLSVGSLSNRRRCSEKNTYETNTGHHLPTHLYN